ncbi:unnamed protein product [Aphanomyces euteiches]
MAYEATWAADPAKLNKAELMKLEKDGLDVIRTIIEQYATEGYDAITEDDMNRFKWAGVYQQKPNNGHFMMRVRINAGLLNSDQARALAEIAALYGRDLMDVTTRQAIQYHWLQIENMPDIFKRLEAVGLFSYEACGDCPRTIVGNPLQGIDQNELFDTTDLVNQVNDFFLLNRDFSNLPRRLSGAEFKELARLSDVYGDGHIRTTISQNIIISGVPDDQIEAILNESILERLTPDPRHFMSRTVSCTGNEFCNLAVVETKERAKAVAAYLDDHVKLDEEVRIHFIGCPNACGQKHIADIGLQGALIRTPDGMVDAFDIAVGGILGPNATFNTTLKGRVLGDKVGPVLEQLILFYKENRSEEETFHQYFQRIGAPAFQEKLTQILAS